ncbi:hypothetical protein EVAR_28563_1 [Eumeta japonica]|uniref:Uncharacterized protein n=1 Tax=Eumeta variegata TaxID=151549 RepID=A0A4C1UY96_EUMVA|nr:hypothetical protein EVAR_28563_1 [Eumeta japonica]
MAAKVDEKDFTRYGPWVTCNQDIYQVVDLSCGCLYNVELAVALPEPFFLSCYRIHDVGFTAVPSAPPPSGPPPLPDAARFRPLPSNEKKKRIDGNIIA